MDTKNSEKRSLTDADMVKLSVRKRLIPKRLSVNEQKLAVFLLRSFDAGIIPKNNCLHFLKEIREHGKHYDAVMAMADKRLRQAEDRFLSLGRLTHKRR